jgi:hypothetical protein
LANTIMRDLPRLRDTEAISRDIYIDDILIFSKTEAKHQAHVRLVLEMLKPPVRLYIDVGPTHLHFKFSKLEIFT